MKKIFFLLALLLSLQSFSQQFISSGLIEYQVVKNNHKMIGDEGFWAEQFKDKIPRLTTSYYHFTFENGKGVYKFDRNDAQTAIPWGKEQEDEIWYSDYNTRKATNYKYAVDNYYLLDGSLMDIEWKLSPAETRVIAGFNCRKATGIIFDSVYVFAFYTDEITVSGGPMGISGLPGTILGLTIPRTFTSWVATKVQVAGVDTRKIQPPTRGKKMDKKELMDKIIAVSKNWGDWGQQTVWQLGL